MDFSWTSEQDERYRASVDFARSRLSDDVVARDHACEFPAELWRRCAEHGVLGWAQPERVGGSGLSTVTAVRCMEALGYGCRDNGLTLALGAQMWNVQTALLRFGTPEQQERYLVPAIRGEMLAASAITEEGSGSDAFALATVARKDGRHYVLTGEKVMVTFGPVADFALVFAVTDPAAGRWGLSAFLVDAGTPGYEAHGNEAKMGLRTVPLGRLTLEECRVAEEALLGPAGAGASVFSHFQGWERSLVLAPQVGAMQHLLERCVELAGTRRRGGRTIGEHQAVSHRIADMAIRVETSRLLLYKAAWSLERGKPDLMGAAIAKTYLAEAFREASLDALAVHGGAGYATDTAVERNLRDALGGMIYGGTVDIQRNIIAGLCGP